MSDLAVATNLPLVLERQPSPELHITGSLFPNAKPIPLQRNNHHNLNIACAGGLDFPKALLDRITPPLDWSSLSSNQSSNPAADQANRQQRIRINYSDLETTPSSSCLTSSLQSTLLSWTPIAFMNIPAVTEGKGEDLFNKTNHRPVSGHFVAQIIVPPHHSSISTAKIIEETPRLVTAINISLSNSEKPATHTCLNRSTRWSAPTPLVVPTDEAKWRHHLRIKSSYAKVDPFPSPTPGKRFSNIGTPGDHSPRQASLPDWVIHEYLSAGDNRKKLDPRGPLNSLHIHPTCNSQNLDVQYIQKVSIYLNLLSFLLRAISTDPRQSFLSSP
ncbi:hypothetical protein PCANC_02793 [Puccinia coronata f. sp. avenae]|uniref:Uncharacterized protein n=1 Tax=Puccinia coronata f. sp. avenae TaxID=200324 RepID=A0A2N5W4B3_9BASI|nr:hypothetical protein PCANC_02793 [Puccinia coronata f. sp. avenae]